MVTTAQIPCSVDSIIFGSGEESLNLLPLKRTFEPARGEGLLVGGFVQGNGSVGNAASGC